MQTWNHHYWISLKLPPEELFVGEVITSFEVDALDKVVIFGDTFDSPPEIPFFKLILWAEGFDTGLQIGFLFNWESLSDSVDELEFGVEVGNVHLMIGG